MKFERTAYLLDEYRQSGKKVSVSIRNGLGSEFNGTVTEVNRDDDEVIITIPVSTRTHHVTISEIVIISDEQ